jgi:hypothetical protein
MEGLGLVGVISGVLQSEAANLCVCWYCNKMNQGVGKEGWGTSDAVYFAISADMLWRG